MENGGFFKTAAFGGFEKKDVLNYVDELHRKIFKLESDVSKAATENEQLSAQLASMQEQQQDPEAVESLGQQIASLGEALEALENAVEERDATITELRAQVEERTRYAAAKESEIATLNARIAQLSQRVAKYDETSLDVGTVILDARHTADQIIREAKAKADAISADAVSYVSQFDQKINQLQTAIEDINSSLEENLKKQIVRGEALVDMIKNAQESVKISAQETSEDAENDEATAEEQSGIVAPELPYAYGKVELPEQEEVAAPSSQSDTAKSTWQPDEGDENIFC